jgi:hypothetical protein
LQSDAGKHQSPVDTISMAGKSNCNPDQYSQSKQAKSDGSNHALLPGVISLNFYFCIAMYRLYPGQANYRAYLKPGQTLM